MKTFTIDRARWFRGQGSGDSALFIPENNKMCCLGFYLSACGVENLAYMKTPGTIYQRIPQEAEWLIREGGPVTNSYDCLDLMQANDCPDDGFIDQREEVIKDIFAGHDIEVIFEGE